jgi:hypothetical protein
MNGFEGSYQMHELINETVFKILERKRTNSSLPQKKQQLYKRICNFMNGFEGTSLAMKQFLKF